jgi:hypothetical protein
MSLLPPFAHPLRMTSDSHSILDEIAEGAVKSVNSGTMSSIRHNGAFRDGFGKRFRGLRTRHLIEDRPRLPGTVPLPFHHHRLMIFLRS